MTGQVTLDSYADAGVFVTVDLINELAVSGVPRAETVPAVARILAIDPPSVALLDDNDAPGFVALAERLRRVVTLLDAGDVDAAAAIVNEMLSDHPAHPHLAKEDGRWRLHHHPADIDVVPMWTSICAESVARMIGAGHGDRLGVCQAGDCDRVFVDQSKNGSRRFCSTTCQNRVKAAAFRRRHNAQRGIG
jgi:predicted RNA-binding Zn ribbon-like protein